jgi:hypothetical protein
MVHRDASNSKKNKRIKKSACWPGTPPNLIRFIKVGPIPLDALVPQFYPPVPSSNLWRGLSTEPFSAALLLSPETRRLVGAHNGVSPNFDAVLMPAKRSHASSSLHRQI